MILVARDPALAVDFEGVLSLVADVCNVPMAAIASYQGGQLHFESCHGSSMLPTSFCSYAILQDCLMEVTDALEDDRFRQLPQVLGPPFIRFYLGAPLVSPAGQRLGTLAIFDSTPRQVDDLLRSRVKALAHQVMIHLELHRQYIEVEKLAAELDRANGELREQAEHLKQAQDIARIGSWKYLINEDSLHLSAQILKMYGLAPDSFDLTMEDFLGMVHVDDQPMVQAAKDAAIRDGFARVQCHVVRADGEIRYFDIIGQLFHEPDGRPYLAGTTQDITEQKATEDKIRHLAYYDQLTGLPNRQLVLDRIERLVAMRRRMEHDSAILFIDLDNFKTLNDTQGHDMGDLLLQQVGQRLQACVRQYDCVGRFGGDEFIVLLEKIGDGGLDSATHAMHIAQKIVSVLNQPYMLGSLQHRITPSIGIALIDNEVLPTNDLLKRADMAMYKAKSEGRNAIRFFNPHMQEAVQERAELEADLRQALADRAFYLDYQPQVDASGQIDGVEALLRWHHPRRGLVSPAYFIPLAEELGLIMEIGGWLLGEACAQLRRWTDNPAMRELVLSINISARQFHHPGFVEQIMDALAQSEADPARLKIEITENILISDIDDTRRKMMALKAAGVRFTLDDFGTGYSSLSYLQRLPLDQLKIDQSFVRDVMTDKNDAAITRSIIALAHNLGLSVIAEGVETEDQRRFLADEGCLNYQGYFYHRPLTAAMVEVQVASTRLNLH